MPSEGSRRLAIARQLFDAPANGLAAAAQSAGFAGFGQGAEWMRSALGVVRGRAPTGGTAFTRLGCTKYGLAVVAAVAVAWLAVRTHPVFLPSAVIAFYVVEVRLVFAFPLALDGSAAPLRASHRLVARTMPWWVATACGMRIAAEMLLGGFVGRGFLRSWCVGCLAVLLWYEEARRLPEAFA